MLIQRNKANPDILYGAIKQRESQNHHYWTPGDYNPQNRPIGAVKVSGAGAVGISQILPSTAKTVAERNGIVYDQKRLYNDPKYNDQLGRLAFMEEYQASGGDIATTAARYNRGATNFNETKAVAGENWLQHSSTPEETKKYVKAVNAFYLRGLGRSIESGNEEVIQARETPKPANYLEQLNRSRVDAIKSEVANKAATDKIAQSVQYDYNPDPVKSSDAPVEAPILPSSQPYGPTQEVYGPPPAEDVTYQAGDQEPQVQAPIKEQNISPTPKVAPEQIAPVDQSATVQTVDNYFHTDNEYGPPTLGAVDQNSVPGPDSYPTPYYESQGILGSGVINNDSYGKRVFDKYANEAQDGTLGTLMQMYQRWDSERDGEKYGVTKLSPDEANRRYPGLPQPFTEPVNPMVAKLIFDENARRRTDGAWAASGDSLGFVSNMLIGAATFIGDPVNLATMGLAAPRIAGLGISGLKAVILENAAISSGSQLLTGINRKQQRDEIPTSEAIGSILENTAFGTAFHYGLQYIAPRMKEAGEYIKKNSPEQAKLIIGRFGKNVDAGQQVSIADKALDQAKQEAGRVPVGSGLEHVHNEDINLETTQFFTPIKDGKPVPIANDLGLSIAVDNPNSARNVGESVRVLTPKGEFLKLDTSLDNPEVAAVLEKLKTAGVKIELPKGSDVEHLIMAAQESGNLKAVHDAFKESGFSGYRDTVAYHGVDVSNRLHVFDPESSNYSESIPVDPDKVYNPSYEEEQSREAELDNPDNSIYKDGAKKEVTKFSEPTDGVPESTFLEGERARRTLDLMSGEDPFIAEELKNIDEIHSEESLAEKAVPKLLDGDLGEDLQKSIAKSLAKEGVAAPEELVAQLAEALQNIKSRSLNDAEFRDKATDYFERDVIGWATKKKIERTRFLLRLAEETRNLEQVVSSVGKPLTFYEKLYSFVHGGSAHNQKGGNTGTDNSTLAPIYRTRLRGMWGEDGLKVLESGLINKEVIHELSNIEAGGTKSVSGNEMAYKLAKDYNEIKESLFALKLGYSPFLNKILQHLFKQTHSRELISAVSFEDWFEFTHPRYGDSSFPELSYEKQVKEFSRIYEEIKSGMHGKSAFDTGAGETNIAYRIAKGRTLIPKDWEAFHEYNERFGKSDLAMTMLDSISNTAKEIAVMSKLTSTPKKFVDSLIKHASSRDPSFDKEFEANKDKFKAAFAAATFQYDAPALNIQARTLVGVQKLYAAVFNGGQWLSSFSDFAPATMQTNALGQNLFSSFIDLFGSYWKHFSTNSKAAAEAAESLGVFSRSGQRNLHAELGAENTKSGFLGSLLEWHTWASLMDRHQNAMSAAIGEVTAKRLAVLAETPWAELSPSERSGLERYGFTERRHAILKHAIVENDGYRMVTPGSLLDALEKTVQIKADLLGVDTKDIVTLEKSPKVKSAEESIYSSKSPRTNPYAESRGAIVAPRPESGADLGEISRAYKPEIAGFVASDAKSKFLKAGFTEQEAHVPATLISTFFDSIGKATGKDSYELYKKYGLGVERVSKHLMDSLGTLEVAYNEGQGDLNIKTLKNVAFDKSVIHEMSHFFLESLRDVQLSEGLSGDFKKGSDALFKWLDVGADGNPTIASHERFANSFEVFLRTTKAPPKLEGIFAQVRDWYRRALFMARAGLARMPFSLARPERAPVEVEAFYKSLMGGEGTAQHLGDLKSMMEVMPQEDLAKSYSPLEKDPTPLPTEATDLVLAVAALINEHAQMGTTSASGRDRTFMYEGSNVNTLHGQLMRSLWAFKSSSISQINSMRRSLYSNPERPNGDWARLTTFAGMTMGLWAISDAAKSISSNKKPQNPMDNPQEYAIRALIGSGALGPIGDTVGRAVTQNKSVKSGTLDFFKSMFPTLGSLADLGVTAGMAARSAVDPTYRFPGNDVGRNIEASIPFQNLFWMKAVMHKYFIDSIREFLSPGFKMRQDMNNSRHGQDKIFN